MSDAPHVEWPREIWMAEREEHDQGVVSAVLSEWATIARWDGDKERDRDFHRYVDADIYDSAEKYWKARHAELTAALDRVRQEERERCAGIARNRWKAWTEDSGVSCDATACENIAAAIMGGEDE